MFMRREKKESLWLTKKFHEDTKLGKLSNYNQSTAQGRLHYSKDKMTYDYIKKAYLKRAMETHPDRGGTQEDFQRVTVSYKALMIKLKNETESHEHNELRDNSSQFMNEQQQKT